MPEWVWFFIVPSSIGIIVFLGWLLAHRGGTVRAGKLGSIVIHGTPKEEGNPLGRALRYVPENISQVHNLIYSHYLKAVKAKGVDTAAMTEVEDAQFARLLIRLATSLGNGTNSIQKILESDISHRDWDGTDIEAYVRRTVMPRAIDALRTIINSEYDSTAHYAEHSSRLRVISQAEFVDLILQDEFQEALVEKLLPFYEFAKRCLDGGCRE